MGIRKIIGVVVGLWILASYLPVTQLGFVGIILWGLLAAYTLWLIVHEEKPKYQLPPRWWGYSRW